MMRQVSRPVRRGARRKGQQWTSLVAYPALSLSGKANASSYAYARQELTNFTITVEGSNLSNITLATNTTNTATLQGIPTANNSNSTNASEVYVDKPPNSTVNPGENSFTAKGATGPS
jgi:hypothetical protein